jgi:hypothetical protein
MQCFYKDIFVRAAKRHFTPVVVMYKYLEKKWSLRNIKISKQKEDWVYTWGIIIKSTQNLWDCIIKKKKKKKKKKKERIQYREWSVFNYITWIWEGIIHGKVQIIILDFRSIKEKFLYFIFFINFDLC